MELKRRWLKEFGVPEQGMIANCLEYANKVPPGVPVHPLMLIVAKMADMLDKLSGPPGEADGT